jgi:hypothetical protein
LTFSALTGVRSMNETFPLERAAEGYDHMMSGSARFRVVLMTGIDQSRCVRSGWGRGGAAHVRQSGTAL